MPDGTPGRLLERLGLAPPDALLENPGLFCTPPLLGDPERSGAPARLLAPGRFCMGRLATPPRLVTCRFSGAGRLGAPPPVLLLGTTDLLLANP